MSSFFLADYAKSTFGSRVVRKLAKKGITLLDVQLAPDMGNRLHWANPTTGYIMNVNGTARGMSFDEVLKAAA